MSKMAGNRVWYWLKVTVKVGVILLCVACIFTMIAAALEEMELLPEERRTEKEIKDSLDYCYYDGEYGELLRVLGRDCWGEEEKYERYWNIGRFYEAYQMMDYWEEQDLQYPEKDYQAYVQKYRLKMEQEYENCAGEENLRIMKTFLEQ